MLKEDLSLSTCPAAWFIREPSCQFNFVDGKPVTFRNGTCFNSITTSKDINADEVVHIDQEAM